MTPEEIIDRWQSPEFTFKPDMDDGGWLRGQGFNHICGDEVQIFVKLATHNHLETGLRRVIENARHITHACTLTSACADVICEHLIGKPIDVEINPVTLLGIPVGINRRQCVLAPWQAVLLALKDYR